MSQDLLFPEMPVAKPGHPLFVAIFPPAELQQHIAAVGGELRQKHRLTGRQRSQNNLHITLCDFSGNKESFEKIVEVARIACGAVASAVPPFEIGLDRAQSFKGREGNSFVLKTSVMPEALKALRARLLAEFVRQGCLPKFESGNNPHVTLLYDKQLIVEHPIEPVCWTAGEIVLVESHVGEGRYSFLGRWNLDG